ncbi:MULTISPECIES: SGNH/GDSL hydrolase family protein [Bacillus cereus group]|uniref:SGNH/GDSL hydrolase family protein n=1 Tax=Bacillus cereus group TaxID=86661 RepID=UPI000B4483A7|nr:SGNH/GDSL hydrolase family protein [Bacillus toyonensis]OTX06626.1 esterase [Bacillus thuringiensis serovar seoulensis]QPW47740.1 SGNH/GDSL hydrolase family protein [Bacillus thuringiensis]MCA1045901.1 SGNH/GDSL hydrolase family protein [Bacillus toyonensis]MDO8156297.1 esterase [Bacillus toyonensis]MED3197690.1 SGNH/GDSL hydrolase family protein [Bacillus toyonensis]
MKTLVCFGDSITADDVFFDGIPRLTPRLQVMFPDWKVVNAGVPGDNTFNALNRIEEDVISYKPDFVTVFLGTNDAVSFSQVSLQVYKKNLEKIVNQVSSDKVLLISPAPVDEERQHNRTNRVLSQYADVVEEVARETGSYFLNVFAEMIQEQDYKRFVENDEKDGLHFGPEGYEYVAKLIGEKLKGIL